MTLWRYNFYTFIDQPVIFRSTDHGASWEMAAEGPDFAGDQGTSGAVYDSRYGGEGQVRIDSNAVSTIQSVYPGEPWVSPVWRFVGFDFQAGAWGAPYGGFSDVTRDFATKLDGSPVYADTLGVVVGAAVVGTCPYLTIDGSSNAHYGPDPAFVTASEFHPAQGWAGNVRLFGGQLVFPQAYFSQEHMQVLSRPVGSPTWSVEEVAGAFSGPTPLFALNAAPWLYSRNVLYFIGADQRSIYRTLKSGAWTPAQLIYSSDADTNPDVTGLGAIRDLIVTRNPILGGVDVSFDYDGLASGSGWGVLTFHVTQAANRYYGT